MRNDIFANTTIPNCQNATEAHFGIQEGQFIYTRACQILRSHWETMESGGNIRIRFHMKYNLLPIVSYYQAMLEAGADREKAVALAVAESDLFWEKQSARLTKVRGMPWKLFRLIGSLIVMAYPASGWDIRLLRRDLQEIQLDVTRCFYYDSLKKYGVPELVPAFCNADVILYRGMEPWVYFLRTETLAGGNKRCDFRYVDNRKNLGKS